MKPDPKRVLRDAHRLQSERYAGRDRVLKDMELSRFRKKPAEIPPMYANTSVDYQTPAMEEEGRAIASLVNAFPQVKMIAPTPEDQPLTTKCEKFLMAAHLELESANGSVWWKCRLAQIHQKIGWIKAPLKRAYYQNAPRSPGSKASIEELLEFDEQYEKAKREGGIAELFDYEFVPTRTVYTIGADDNPYALYEIKWVDEDVLCEEYGLTRDKDGKLSKPDVALTTMPAGTPDEHGVTQTRASERVKVIEYWNRQWCCIIAEQKTATWMGMRQSVDGIVLDEWEHETGRVPYFAAPAFENEVMDEEFRYETPLNGIYAEAPMYNMYRRMMSNVAYLKGYPSWQLLQKETGDLILDDEGNPRTHLSFQPGEFLQLKAGQVVQELPMNGGNELPLEAQASEVRMKSFSLSEIARGVSPGADTANSAISQLRRLQRASLDPMAMNSARQAKALYTYWLRCIKEKVKETVYVYGIDPAAGTIELVDLAPDDIPTYKIEVTVQPDTGQDSLIEEKQAFELMMGGAITPIEFHERRGKENPEEFVIAQTAWEVFQQMKPQLELQVMAGFGDTNAITQLMAANQQAGDAKEAIPGLLEQLSARQNGGGGAAEGGGTPIGSGAGGMPRQEGVRSATLPQTTQPGAEQGPF